MNETEAGFDSTPSRARLDELIGQSIEGINNLEALLDRELDALKRQDAAALETLAVDKEACVRGLDALEIERRKLATAAGFSIDGDGMLKLLESCGEPSKTADQWQELLTIAARCEKQNRQNGAISRVRQEQVRAALALLSGDFDSNHQAYDPAGRGTGRTGHHRELAQA